MPKQNNPDKQFNVNHDVNHILPDKLSRNPEEKRQQIEMVKAFALTNKRVQDYNKGTVSKEDLTAALNKTMEVANKNRTSNNPGIRNQSISALRMVESELQKLSKELGGEKKDLLKSYGELIKQAEATNHALSGIASRMAIPGAIPKKSTGIGGALKKIGAHYAGAVYDNMDPIFHVIGDAIGHASTVYKAAKARKANQTSKTSPKAKALVSRTDTSNNASAALSQPTPSPAPSAGLDASFKQALDAQSATLQKIFGILVETEEMMVESLHDNKTHSQLITSTAEKHHKEVITELRRNAELVASIERSLVTKTAPEPVKARESAATKPVLSLVESPKSSVPVKTEPKEAPKSVRLDNRFDNLVTSVGKVENVGRGAGSNDADTLKRISTELQANGAATTVGVELLKKIEQAELTNVEQQKLLLKGQDAARKEAEIQSLKALEAGKGHSTSHMGAGTKGIDTPKGKADGLGLFAGAFAAIANMFKDSQIAKAFNLVKDSKFIGSIKGFFGTFEAIGGLMKSVSGSIANIGSKIVSSFKDIGEIFNIFGKFSGLADLAKIAGKVLKGIPILGTVVGALSAIWDGLFNAEKILDKAGGLDIRDHISAAVGSFVGGFVDIVDIIAGVFNIDTKIKGKTLGEWTKEITAKGVDAILHPIETLSKVFDAIKGAFVDIAKKYVAVMPDFLVPDGLKEMASGKIESSSNRKSNTAVISQTEAETAKIKEKAAKATGAPVVAQTTNNVNAGTTNVYSAPLGTRNDDRSISTDYSAFILP